ncbi:hypothetical protein V6N13_030106 [Hibiscus sabdariffa]
MGLEEGTNSGEGTWCGEGIKCFNNELVDNGFGQLSLSLKVKVQDGGKASIEQIGCSGVVVEEEKREKVPSFSNDIAMALIEEELGQPW